MRDELRQLMLFARDAAACLALVALLCAGLWILSVDPQSYAAVLPQKYVWLASALSPRVIFVGGSGVAMGIDSPLVKKETGLNPINMGLYGGLGMRFILSSIESSLRSGDTVVILPEYETLQQPATGDGILLLDMLHANPERLPQVLTVRGAIVMLRYLPLWLRGEVAALYEKDVRPLFGPQEPTPAERIDTKAAFNSYGDVDTALAGNIHVSTTSLEAQIQGFVRPASDPDVIADLKSFISKESSAGVVVYIAPPSLPQTIYNANLDPITQQYQALGNALGQEHILGAPKDFVFPDDTFLDSEHPNQKGKELKTQLVIKLLTQARSTNVR